MALKSHWPGHKAVAHLPGSLPMGGVVEMTPIHAFEQTPAQLDLGAVARDALEPRRFDLEMGELTAFVIDPVLSSEEADHIVEASELFGYREEAPGISTPPGIRMNKSVHWMADEKLMNPIFQRISHLLAKEVQGKSLYPALSHRINMYRYDDEDVFNLHIDGSWPGYSLNSERTQMLEWPRSVQSEFSMLLYLNGPTEGVRGGNTRLFRKDGSFLDVEPVKGAALFFRHGFGPSSVRHIGCKVSGPISKYLARINVMYESK